MTTSAHVGWKRRVIAVLIAIVFVAGSTAGLSILVMPKDNRAEAGMIDPETNAFLAERKNSIDVLFVGDSLAYRTFSPPQMWHEKGFTSYCASTAGQNMAYGNTLLNRALSVQSPRVVVLETNFYTLSS